MVRSFSAGSGYALRGLRLLNAPGIRRYVAVPLLINIVVFSGGLWWVKTTLASLISGWVATATGWLPGWLDWLGPLLNGLIWLVFGVSALIAVFYTFSMLANLLASPFNGLLAERIERGETGHQVDSGVSIWKEIAVAPAQEIGKLLYFLLWAIPFLILFLIPVVNVAAPFLWAGFSAWMLALQYVDYPLGNHGIRFAEQRRLLRKNRQLAMGFGSVILLLTVIPVINFIAMPAAVIGATLMSLDHLHSSGSQK